MAALIVLQPACAGPAVHDNLTQGRYAAATAENSSAAAVAPSIDVGMAQVLAADDYNRAIEAGTAALAAAADDNSLQEKLADAYIARAWYYKAKRLNPYTSADLFKAIGYQWNGGFAEYMIMPKKAVDQGCLIPIPQDLSPELGTLIEPLS